MVDTSKEAALCALAQRLIPRVLTSLSINIFTNLGLWPITELLPADN